MLAYHNDPKLRKSVIAQMVAHRKADELVQGYAYWKDGKGCAVGCLLKSGNHVEYETKFGIPQMLAHLEDCIFEGLPVDKAKKWPERFLSAITPGQDLSTVGWEFQHRLQINNLEFAKQQKFPNAVIKAIELVIDILEPMTKGKKVDEAAARSAAAAAEAAAAEAGAAAAAAEAAGAAAAAAAEAAWSAAAAAAGAAAWSAAAAAGAAAWSAAAYEEMADLLIDIIKAGH